MSTNPIKKHDRDDRTHAIQDRKAEAARLDAFQPADPFDFVPEAGQVYR